MAAELSRHIALLFEFPTLNGGEHSMLAVLNRLVSEGEFHFSAMAPWESLLAERLLGLGIPAHPFSVRPEYGPADRRLEELGFPVHPSTRRSGSGRKRETAELLPELQDIVQQHQPALVHANSLSMCRLLGQARAQLKDVRCTGHIRDIMKLSAAAIRDLNQLDGLAAVSQATQQFHVAQGLDEERVTVIYNGVDTARFRRRDRADARRALLPDLPATARVLLNVGQICLRKGQLDLALAIVQLLRTSDDLHLVLAGERHSEKAESIAYEQAIVDAFESAGKADHLHRPGYCDNIEHWMNAADLLVHSARQEPLGRVLLEAAASELPVVTTNVGGTPEIFRQPDSVVLVPPNDVNELSSRVEEALRRPDRCRRMAARARQGIEERFTTQQAADRLREFWRTATSP